MSTKILMQPWVPSSASHQVCEQIFPQSSLNEDQSEFNYSTINDFGRKIHKLLFCTPKAGFSSHYFENMKEIGSIEGFEVCASQSVHSVRDAKLRAADDKILEPTCSSSLPIALERCLKRNEYLKNHASFLTDHPSVAETTIGVVATNKMHRRTCDGIDKKNQRESRLYFEGGNIMTLTNSFHIPQFIIGEDLAIITHQALRKDQWFHKPNPTAPNASYYDENLIFQKYGDKITPLYLSGDIPDEITKIAQRFSKIITDDEVEDVLEEMLNMGLITTLKFNSEAQKAKGREIVCDYLAQEEFVRTEIFSAELRCSADRIKFIPQIAYHLDVLMSPGPKGSIFLQDYEKSVQLLQTIAANAATLNLTREDRIQLQSFINTTRKLGQDLKPLMDRTNRDLEDAGYMVIPTPGAFYSFDQGQPFNLNFLNSLTGFSDKTGHFYYIAPGSQTKGNLARVLMDSYVEFLKSHCNNIAVYFAGRNPNDPTDFSEAIADMNRKKMQLGPHCLSFELDFAPHHTNET